MTTKLKIIEEYGKSDQDTGNPEVQVALLSKRIDTVYREENIPENFANFLNIDIQGAELLALKSMGNILNNFDYLYLEVNKEEVYKDCALVEEIDEYLDKYNFKRVELEWTFASWGDALYIKNK